MDLLRRWRHGKPKPWIVRCCLLAPDEVRHIDKRISAWSWRNKNNERWVWSSGKTLRGGNASLGWLVPRYKCNNGICTGPPPRQIPDKCGGYASNNCPTNPSRRRAGGTATDRFSIFRAYFCIWCHNIFISEMEIYEKNFWIFFICYITVGFLIFIIISVVCKKNNVTKITDSSSRWMFYIPNTHDT